MKNDYLVKLLCEHPLAIHPAKLQQIEAFLQYRLAGGPAVQFEAAAGPSYTLAGQSAVIPVFGVISKRMNMLSEMSGGTSVERLGAQIREAVADPGVRNVILQVSSPGGSVYGVQELAQEIIDLRERKRIIAVADDVAASAAYWIAASASELVVTPSGEVGSIGVVAMHVDYSAQLEREGMRVTYVHAGQHKVEGNPAEPLDSEARAFLQSRVDEYYGAFVAGVAKGRGVARSVVKDSFGQGRMYGAQKALEVGMVDRVATLAEVIRGAQPRTRVSRTAALAAEADIAAAVLKAS